MDYDILIAGVGGQGTVLASRLIAAAAIASGWDAATSETIGMAQRGGSVTSHVRIGARRKSALIPDGKADLLIGFEPAEAARNIHKLRPQGHCLVHTQPVQSVISNLNESYQDTAPVLEYIRAHAPRVVCVNVYENEASDASGTSAGISKAFNVVLIAAAIGAGMIPVSAETMLQVIEQNVPAKYLELNRRAFAFGLDGLIFR